MKKIRKAGRISNGIYLDYAASTPVAREVKHVMQPYFSRVFGNPGSLHSFGQEAIAAIDKAREKIAVAIRAEFREVIFTSGATEANNLALRGVVERIRNYELGIRGKDIPNSRPKIIVSAIEHESILDTAYALEREGVEVEVLPVDKGGVVDLKKLETMLDERTVLVSVMYVNNEIGSVQPIAKISEIIRNFRNVKVQISNVKSMTKKQVSKKSFGIAGAAYPLLHVDAAQAFEYLECDAGKLGVDLMTLSSQKIYGPKGAGALFIKSKFKNQNSKIPLSAVSPLITGGGQEFGFRSGTENVPAIAGFGEAVRRAEKEREVHAKQVGIIKNYFLKGLKRIYPNAEINGVTNKESGIGNPKTMAPHILNVCFPTEFAGDLLIKMDMAGIAASSGSACSARSFTPSHVLEAIGLPPERVRGSVRFSFGTPTTKAEIDEVVRRMEKILKPKR